MFTILKFSMLAYICLLTLNAADTGGNSIIQNPIEKFHCFFLLRKPGWFDVFCSSVWSDCQHQWPSQGIKNVISIHPLETRTQCSISNVDTFHPGPKSTTNWPIAIHSIGILPSGQGKLGSHMKRLKPAALLAQQRRCVLSWLSTSVWTRELVVFHSLVFNTPLTTQQQLYFCFLSMCCC